MRMSFIKGITAGALIGATAGMIIAPQLDRSTKRRIRKSGRMMANAAEDMYGTVKGWMK